MVPFHMLGMSYPYGLLFVFYSNFVPKTHCF